MNARLPLAVTLLGASFAAFVAGSCTTTSQKTATATLTDTAVPTAVPPPTATPTWTPIAGPCIPTHISITACGSYDHALTVSAAPQTFADSFSSGQGVRFSFAATAGLQYHFSFCANGGGYTSGCADAHVQEPTNCQDWALWTACGTTNETVWTAPFSGTFALWVHAGVCTTNGPSCFTMAYWTTVPPTPLPTNTITFTVTPVPPCTPTYVSSGSCASAQATLVPGTTPQVWASSFTMGTEVYFRFACTAGQTYHFSTCAFGGGYDTNCAGVFLVDASCAGGMGVATYCNSGTANQVDWTASYTGNAYGYIHNSLCFASGLPSCYRLAYWKN